MPDYDAVIVGAGPNGLAAAVTLARAGWSALVCEAKDTIGGGARSAALTLPGYVHDVCSAIHPLGLASPFFRSLPLQDYGLEWIHPEIPLAHPLGDSAAVLLRSLDETAALLEGDGRAYRRLMQPFVSRWQDLLDDILGPLPLPPRHPLLLARFGLPALLPASGLAKFLFKGEKARALFAGIAAHAFMPLEHMPTASFGLALGLLGHAVGWPLARGGTQQITNAAAAYLRSLNGVIETGREIKSLDELPSARVVLLDLTPRQFVRIAGERLPAGYRRQLERYRYGMGVFKLDWALSEPIPWTAEACRRAGTVHVGGTLDEIAAGERQSWRGQAPQAPFVLVAQQSLFDPTRAPEGRHTGWAYCHVPHGSTEDMTARIERQIERFAPGFRETILARRARSAAEYEQYNPNFVGGDINGGVQDLRQLFTRPTLRLTPYSTPLRGVYLCSSSTPPGGGVHGMSGYHAARAALRAWS